MNLIYLKGIHSPLILTRFTRNGSTELQSFVWHKLSKHIFTIFTVSGVTAVRSHHGVMSSVPDIITLKIKRIIFWSIPIENQLETRFGQF